MLKITSRCGRWQTAYAHSRFLPARSAMRCIPSTCGVLSNLSYNDGPRPSEEVASHVHELLAHYLLTVGEDAL